jgi:hypothetical protein
MSSVLALGRSAKRGYYGGWKAVMEAATAELVKKTHGALLSILYPGRLVETRSIARPMSLLSASYHRAARAMICTARSTTPQGRVLGFDARIWLVLRGVIAWKDALAGRPKTEFVQHG